MEEEEEEEEEERDDGNDELLGMKCRAPLKEVNIFTYRETPTHHSSLLCVAHMHVFL